jgi:hypothetical protein
VVGAQTRRLIAERTATGLAGSWHHAAGHAAARLRDARRDRPWADRLRLSTPIRANYSQGSGTIVSKTPANKATRAALAAYPGGVVDRVVKLSSGGYEVHDIGVNWPHHIFVNTSFKVIGAD